MNQLFTSIKWCCSVGENCSNPKYLQKNIGAGVLDLNIWGIKISTFDDYLSDLQLNYHEIVQNDTFFEWTDSYLNYHRGGCHTFELKPSVTKHGIKYVSRNPGCIHLLNTRKYCDNIRKYCGNTHKYWPNTWKI